MKHIKLFFKGLTTGFIDGEKKLMLPEEATASKEDLETPAGALGWLLRCYLSGMMIALALLGLIAKANGYFDEETE